MEATTPATATAHRSELVPPAERQLALDQHIRGASDATFFVVDRGRQMRRRPACWWGTESSNNGPKAVFEVLDGVPGTLAREDRILQLRIQGWSYPRIAKELGISVSTAHARGQAAIARLHESVVHHADQLRMLQLVRYEAMVASLWEQATTPWARGQLHAMEQLTRVMERIDRVGGTEAPMRRIVRVVDEATLYAATQKIEAETDEMEA